MRVLVEGYSYAKEDVKGVLPEGKLLLTRGKVKIEHVGYYRSAACDDFVFFLPKVVLETVDCEDVNGNRVKGDRVFCKWKKQDDKLLLESSYAPEALLDLTVDENGDHRILPRDVVDFLYGFAVWVYQALAHYKDTNPDTEAVWSEFSEESGSFNRHYVTNTLLDVILALRRFNRENQDYFMFKVQESRSGCRRVNWVRTISRSTAIIQDGAPVYLDLLNKKKDVDFDEELLVIYYSILDYIRRQYNFAVKIGMGYELITGDKFEHYRSGYGEARLRQIKYKYFSDRDLQLWDICFAFFSHAHHANVSGAEEEYLLAKDFHVVFEAMIDELLGDPELQKVKSLDDGKEIDHLYVEKSLTRADDRSTLFIADSKYYKIGADLERKSIAKQFTYARDMLQLNLDLFLAEEGEQSDRVNKLRRPMEKMHVGLQRDPVTEGYDVIPNFFISAVMNDAFDYENSTPVKYGDDENAGKYINIHFENRLFDRDTLILRRYNLNFLYIIKSYAQQDADEQSKWRTAVRKKFRNEIREEILEKCFKFKAIMPHEGVNAPAFFKENLAELQGKVFSPRTPVVGEDEYYLLAVQNDGARFFDSDLLSLEGLNMRVDRIRAENKRIYELVEQYFYVADVESLDKSPLPELQQLRSVHPVVHAPAADDAIGVQVVSRVTGHLMQAVDKTLWCPCPVDQCPHPEKVKVLVLPYSQGAHMYKVVAGVGVKQDLTPAEIVAEFGNAFEGVTFPTANCHFWNVEKIA